MRTMIPLFLLASAALFLARSAWAFDWAPTDDEIKKYRQSWNPFSEGPLLLQSVGVHPHGQLYAVSPLVTVTYGLANHFEVGAAGVLFTIAGENAQDAIYPNFPIQWYWTKAVKPSCDRAMYGARTGQS